MFKSVYESHTTAYSHDRNIETPYMNVLDMMNQLIQQSKGNHELVNNVGVEIKVFLDNVTRNKNASQIFISNLAKLFIKYRTPKEFSLNEDQKKTVIWYLDQLRDTRIESFAEMRFDLEKRFPSIFVGASISMPNNTQITSYNNEYDSATGTSVYRAQELVCGEGIQSTPKIKQRNTNSDKYKGISIEFIWHLVMWN